MVPKKNVTQNEWRRMMLNYYSSDFIGQEINWGVCLPTGIQDNLDEREPDLFWSDDTREYPDCGGDDGELPHGRCLP